MADEPSLDAPDPRDPYQQHTFAQMIASLEDGETHSDLTKQLREMVEALSDAAADRGGKPSGSITLTLAFKLDGGIIEVTPDVKIKTPRVARAKSIFYATPNNGLTRRNPKQAELALMRAVDGGHSVPRMA